MEVLSQEEIDMLIKAVFSNVKNAETNDEVCKPLYDNRRIKIYDFMRPDKFSREQIRVMSILHETFARLASASLSARLRRHFHLHVASVDQLTYEEFIRSIPTPTTLGIVRMNPSTESVVMEIDPAVTFSIVDICFGGEGGPVKRHHELTPIERTVMSGVLATLLENMKEAWSRVADFQPELVQIETQPQFLRTAHPSENIVLITLEARIGGIEGMINVAYSRLDKLGVIEKLSAAYWYGGEACCRKDRVYSDWGSIPVKLTAEIMRLEYFVCEVLEWEEGTLLLPPRPAAKNFCHLRFGSICVWKCEMLEDVEWFLKQIKISGVIETPFRTEVREMEMSKVNPVVAGALSMAEMTVSVELGAASKTVKDILAMGEGTIIELDKVAGDPVDVKANGVLIAKGEVVVIDQYFGVRIAEIVGKSGSALEGLVSRSTAEAVETPASAGEGGGDV